MSENQDLSIYIIMGGDEDDPFRRELMEALMHEPGIVKAAGLCDPNPAKLEFPKDTRTEAEKEAGHQRFLDDIIEAMCRPLDELA